MSGVQKLRIGLCVFEINSYNLNIINDDQTIILNSDSCAASLHQHGLCREGTGSGFLKILDMSPIRSCQ